MITRAEVLNKKDSVEQNTQSLFSMTLHSHLYKINRQTFKHAAAADNVIVATLYYLHREKATHISRQCIHR